MKYKIIHIIDKNAYHFEHIFDTKEKAIKELENIRYYEKFEKVIFLCFSKTCLEFIKNNELHKFYIVRSEQK